MMMFNSLTQLFSYFYFLYYCKTVKENSWRKSGERDPNHCVEMRLPVKMSVISSQLYVGLCGAV